MRSAEVTVRDRVNGCAFVNGCEEVPEETSCSRGQDGYFPGAFSEPRGARERKGAGFAKNF